MNLFELYSPYVMVPAQLTFQEGKAARTVIDWRGVPLASPYRFDYIQMGEYIRIARRWSEDSNLLLKLVHPQLGTTVDYAVRCIFNPEENGIPSKRLFAFLEIAPGCPEAGKTIPVWVVVEIHRPDLVRSLTREEVQYCWPQIVNIIQNRLSSPPEAAQAVLGEFPQWENPDYGDPGNIHLVCLQCLSPIQEPGRCATCNTPTRMAPAAVATPSPQPAKTEAQRSSPALKQCPRCGTFTDSMKQFRLYDFAIFLLIAGSVRTSVYTACPRCMRSLIIQKTAINLIPANLAMFGMGPILAVYYIRTYSKGHSKGVV